MEIQFVLEGGAQMVSKTLLKLSVLVFCFILLSACGYMKDIKEKMNPNEDPVNVRTEEPASPTDGKVTPPYELSNQDFNNDPSTGNKDNSNTEDSSKNDENPAQSNN